MVTRRRSSVPFSSMPRRSLSAAVWSALLGTPLLAAAQVTPDPNAGAHRPGADAAANGVPVVNIVAPSAAGVSHNQYQNFNVDPQGLILNNSAGVSQTQLGGYIVGNPNYRAGQSARVIVNEVTSTNPTYLRGYTEVAGNAADVIIANPNGISVSGAGFINTPRATLTTGVPAFGGDGSLAAFRATRGNISIDGAGLDATYIDRLDLIARSVTANAKLWANNLNIVTGTNQVNYADLSAQTIAGEGAAPGVSLDVAALGGMYANKIYLLGTEAGVGVRNMGELASQAGDFTINQAGQLILAGTTSSSGALTLSGGSLSNSGVLQSGGDMAIQIAGDADNAGTLVSGGNLTVHSGSLSNRGAMQSANSARLQSTADTFNTGTLYSAADLTLSAGGTLVNSHVIAAANNATIRAQQLASSGTLGAGVAGDGNLQGNGALNVATAGTLGATGSNLAAGSMTMQGGALNLSGAQTRAGGDIALTSTAGGIDHRGATLATNDRLGVQSAGIVNNTGGTLQAGQLDMQAAAFANAYGTVTQTGGAPMNVRIGGMLDNTHGRWVANASDMAITAGTLDNSNGAIEHAGSGTLDLITGALINSQGQILGNGNLALSSQTFANHSGLLSVAGNATLAGTDLDNTDGTMMAQTIQAMLTGTLDNAGGLLQASGALRLAANTLNNGNGQIKALGGNLGLTAAQALNNAAGGFIGGNARVELMAGQLNNAGQVYAGSELSLSTQGDAINNGALQAQDSIDANVVGTLTNDNGRLEAGNGQGHAALVVHAGSISNQNGRIANADGGITTVTAAGVLNNTGGTLGGQGDVTLNAGSISNDAGTLVAGGNFALQSGYLSNRNGTLYSAGNLMWDSGGATLDNTAGSLGAGGDIALILDAAHNNGGVIAANSNVTSQFNSFDGIGRLRAGNNLTLTLAGDYMNQAGNTLFANGDFSFNLGGAFTNASNATLQAAGALIVRAASLDNQAGAGINSANTMLIAGTQTNEGRIEGDTITLGAGDVFNTGTIIGNAITINANNLTNGAGLGAQTDNNPYQTALIAAVEQLNLYVKGGLLNRDAMLYTLGDLTIAADASGTRSQSVTNLSGDIEAGRDIFIASHQFTNQRRVLDIDTHTLTAAEQAQNTQTNKVAINGATDADLYNFCTSIYVPHHYACRDDDDINNNDPLQANGHIITTDVVTTVTRLLHASAESRLLAGGNITLNGSVLNDNSSIAAGNNLTINGQDGNAGGGNVDADTVINRAFTPTATVQTTVEKWVSMKEKSGAHGGSWHSQPKLNFFTTQDSHTLALLAGQIPWWIRVDPGQRLSARISAGGAVEISGQDISNTAVGADGKPVTGVGLGTNAGGSPLTGQPVRGAQTVGDSVNPLGPIQLPSNGLYTIHPGHGSPYLVETDPRFASYTGFLGSDYLLGRLGLNGDATLKRLGDAFYETQLVMDQITSLTGRRFLDGDGDPDALDQYKALMDAGAQQAQQFDLAVGVALTPEQIAHLTQDMVWLVNETVGGEQVLVPVVYLSQQTANNVASGAVIQGSRVSLNASRQLTNTGTIHAANDASLQVGNLLNAGSLSAGSALSVQTAQDLLNVGTIQGGNVQLGAGHHLTSSASANNVSLGHVNLDGLSLADAQRLGIQAGGQLNASDTLVAQAGNLTLDHASLNAGSNLGLAAGNDLTATASTINAGNTAQLIAGNNLTLNAGQHTVYQGTSGNQSAQTVHDVTTITAGGNALLAAGSDLTSQAAQVNAGNQLALSAGHDLALTTVTDQRITQGYTREGKTDITTMNIDETLRGNALSATNGVRLSAGHDLTAIAGSLTSEQGNVSLAAGGNINLNAGYENHSWQQDAQSKKSGLFSSTTTTTHDAVQDSYAVGSLLSGDSITVASAHDVNTQAAQIVATHDVVMAAGNNLAIGTATSTHNEQHDQTTKTNGVFTSGLNLMIGASKESQSYSETTTTPQGTLIGSLNGDVTLTAGNLVHITGSDVISQTGTAIVGKDVTIDAAVGTQDTMQTTKQQQAGITVGLGGAVANAVNGAIYSAERGSQVSDDRLKALYAAQAAYGASDAVGLANAGGLSGATKPRPDDPGNPNGLTLQLGIGGSSASSTTTTHDETAYGGHIRSAGDITIAATGGDLNVVGSQIDGHNVALAAANNLNLLSQAEQHTLESSNKNASGGVGIQIGSDGVGFYAQGSVGKGSAHGNGTTHAESLINAGNTLTLVSGKDTTIKGAQLTGNTVIGAIGGNLLIQSEQDTDDYASKQQQLGGKMVIGYGSGGAISYNQSKVNSHYESVNEVSGIQAGSGGFDITVGGNTHLIGGVLASTADPSKNLLDTGSLTYESIHNEANYSASSVGISGGYGAGSSMAGNIMSGIGAALSLATPQHGNSNSDTDAGIAQGTIIVRDGNTDLSGLDRNPTLDSQALPPIFDAQKVQEQMEMGQIAGQVGMRAAGDLAGKMGWAEGSPERAILHGVVGAGIAALGGGDIAQGALGAAANQLVVQKMADYLESQGYTPGTSAFASMLQLASTALGAAVGGGAGAATALDGTTYNYLTHQQLTDLQKEINRCGGDRVCIESAKSNAEIVSANQELDLITGCNAASVYCFKSYAGDISDAIAYMSDPLAAKLGLQVDQSVTTQNYSTYRPQWGLVYGDDVVSQNGQLMFVPAVSGAILGAGPLIATSGTAIGAISGGTGGYISGGWQGAAIGAVVGGTAGRFFPGLAGYVGGKFVGAAGMFVGTGAFAALNGAAGGAGAVATNWVLGQPLNHGVPYAIAAGIFAPLASGEAAVIGIGGEAAVGAGAANAFGAYSGLFSISATALDPTAPLKAKKGVKANEAALRDF